MTVIPTIQFAGPEICIDLIANSNLLFHSRHRCRIHQTDIFKEGGRSSIKTLFLIFGNLTNNCCWCKNCYAKSLPERSKINIPETTFRVQQWSHYHSFHVYSSPSYSRVFVFHIRRLPPNEYDTSLYAISPFSAQHSSPHCCAYCPVLLTAPSQCPILLQVLYDFLWQHISHLFQLQDISSIASS